MDVDKMLKAGIIDESFLEGIAYRIPTEDKYSMLPIRVKGFLPRNSGGNIILPMEITTITGSDFDVDKMYIMQKEFNFDEDTGGFKTVKYDINKDVSTMSLNARNNLLIDIQRAILTHKDTVTRQLSPGGFDNLKITARKLNIISQGGNYTWDQLSAMSLEELDDINSREELDIADYTTQLYLHKQNMTAAKLIGIIANHSTAHALRQFTDVSINRKYVLKDGIEKDFEKFFLNGEFRNSLHDMTVTNLDGSVTYISKNYANFLASAVDAVKDPVLNYLNLNTFTADPAMMLIGAGYSPDAVGLLLRQQGIMDVVTEFENGVTQGVTKKAALNKVIEKYKKLHDDLGYKYQNK